LNFWEVGEYWPQGLHELLEIGVSKISKENLLHR